MTDDDKYGGHNQQGLYVHGPAGIRCALAVLVYFTYCAVSAATPENERKQRVTYRGRDAQRRLTDGEEPPMRMVGRFLCPAKPATSGRKRKAA